MMKRLMAVLLLLLPESAWAGPVVSQADLSSSPQQAQVDLVLTGAPPFHVTYFANPYRIAIDMDAVDWRAGPIGAIARSSLVTGLRHGVQKSGGSRLVLDLTAPARLASARYRTDKSDGKTHLVIDLQTASAASYRQAMDRQQPSARMPSSAMTDAAAAMTTSAGTPSARPAAKAPAQKKTAQKTTAQAAAGVMTETSKQASGDPLLTGLENEALQGEQHLSQDQGNGLGYSSSDGYFVSYMHPPGSLLGAGVTVGMQF